MLLWHQAGYLGLRGASTYLGALALLAVEDQPVAVFSSLVQHIVDSWCFLAEAWISCAKRLVALCLMACWQEIHALSSHVTRSLPHYGVV